MASIIFTFLTSLVAQDVEYKKGIVTVDGVDYVKIDVKKQNFEGFTAKDNLKRAIPIPQKETIKLTINTVDKNYHTLKRIVKWLVDKSIFITLFFRLLIL